MLYSSSSTLTSEPYINEHSRETLQISEQEESQEYRAQRGKTHTLENHLILYIGWAMLMSIASILILVILCFLSYQKQILPNGLTVVDSLFFIILPSVTACLFGIAGLPVLIPKKKQNIFIVVASLIGCLCLVGILLFFFLCIQTMDAKQALDLLGRLVTISAFPIVLGFWGVIIDSISKKTCILTAMSSYHKRLVISCLLLLTFLFVVLMFYFFFNEHVHDILNPKQRIDYGGVHPPIFKEQPFSNHTFA
ncbi:hypothetical protein NEFER03_1917 [Nematocida sp. LUAm3]|nr:hypothetical protein NEFER03_1917 [Nematocida sp. LUAm3]KAI5176181.1 hypothetical protein NEFER02_1995 [Nematocida sp. LUAm2]KAI5179275.1 hypothetical protein NEFER01_2127 [Nematocida sp. LUAm1]